MSAQTTSPRAREDAAGHSTHWRRRVTAALVVVAALALFLRVAPTETEAAWTDDEQGVGTFTAASALPKPVLDTTCTVVPGALGILGAFTMRYKPPAGLTAADVSYSYAVAGNAAFTSPTTVSPTISGPDANGFMSASFGTGLLGLLGSNVYLGVRAQTSGSWVSGYALVHGVVGLAATSSSCTVIG